MRRPYTPAKPLREATFLERIFGKFRKMLPTSTTELTVPIKLTPYHLPAYGSICGG